jgi:outer membrane lipoprotein carrier protein
MMHFSIYSDIISAMSRLCVISAFLVVFLPKVAHSQGVDILSKVQAFYDRTSDLRASFKQVVRTKSPRRTFTRKGVCFLKKPGMMRFDYKEPDEVYYVSDGSVLWAYEPSEGVAYRMNIASSDLAFAFKFLLGLGDLQADFDAKVIQNEGSALIRIVLEPKKEQRYFSSLILLVDPQTFETKETEVIDKGGNVSHLWFYNVTYAPTPPDVFKFTPPSGVKVEDLSRQ